MAKEGSTVSGLMDTLATTDLRRAPVRRAAEGPRQQVRPRPVRAVGLHRQPGDPDRQVDRGLHLPLARLALPVARGQDQPRPPGARSPTTRPRRPLPVAFGGGFDGLGCSSTAEPTPAVRNLRSRPKSTEPDAPKATAVAAEPAAAPEPLAVLATNGSLGNGHAANGNGKTTNGSSGGSTAPITLNLGGTKVSFQTQADAPSCMDCGSIMVRNGSCYKCLNCGSTSGCS